LTKEQKSKLIDLVAKGLATTDQVDRLAKTLGCGYAALARTASDGVLTSAQADEYGDNIATQIAIIGRSQNASLRSRLAFAMRSDFDVWSVTYLAQAKSNACVTRPSGPVTAGSMSAGSRSAICEPSGDDLSTDELMAVRTLKILVGRYQRPLANQSRAASPG
jgi:hypothetical protein